MHYIYYWGEQNHITFLGDSRIRQLYFEFVNLLSLHRIDDHKAHQNLYFEDKKISVKAVCTLKNIFWGNDLPNFHLFYFYNKIFKKKKWEIENKIWNFHLFQVPCIVVFTIFFLAKSAIYTCTNVYVKFKSCVIALLAIQTSHKFVCFQEFLWHPMVNSSMYDVYKNWLMADKSSRPNLLITGSGTVSSVIM